MKRLIKKLISYAELSLDAQSVAFDLVKILQSVRNEDRFVLDRFVDEEAELATHYVA